MTALLERLIQSVVLFLATLIPSDDFGGGGDTGTVILPSYAARSFGDQPGERGCWQIDSISEGASIVMPSTFANLAAVMYSTPNGVSSGVFAVSGGVLELDKNEVEEFRQAGNTVLLLGAFDIVSGQVLDIEFELLPVGDGARITAR